MAVKKKAPQRQQDRWQETREALLRSALECFAAKGFHSTTSRDISVNAGLSHAALYVHFQSKEEILFELSVTALREIVGRVEAAAVSDGGVYERFVGVVRTLLLWNIERHVNSRINNREFPALTAEHRDEVVALRRRIEGTVRRLLEQGVDEGLFVTDHPAMTTVAIISITIDVNRWYRPEGTWTPEEIADHFSGLVLQMVGARAHRD